jgi:hypothetical protein
MVSFPSPSYYCPPSPDKSGARGSLARSTLARATKRCCRCHTAVRATASRESISSASRVGAPRAPRTVIQHRAVFTAAHGAGGRGAPRQRRASDVQMELSQFYSVFSISRTRSGNPGNLQFPEPQRVAPEIDFDFLIDSSRVDQISG